MSDLGSPRARTEALREAAFALGFHTFGVAPAGPADEEGRLRAWLDRGYAGSLSYMEGSAEDRADPRRIVPGARSVVSMSISYYDPGHVPEAPLKVARYAALPDYHGIVRRKLRKLRRRLLAMEPGGRVAPYIDTGPVMERAWAERAGIGWIGKSTMLIGTRVGTYTFLGSLIATTELEYDAPHDDRCGSCTRCLDACPTDAFDGPYVLDATRCVTYWNVETRTPDAPEAVPLFDWLAGCDICQEVCPWNKFARVADEPRFARREALSKPDPRVFTEPSEHEALESVVAGSALQRTGAPAVRRAARRILGLPKLLGDADPPRVSPDEDTTELE